jgi:hypothetical protein
VQNAHVYISESSGPSPCVSQGAKGGQGEGWGGDEVTTSLGKTEGLECRIRNA